jgi:hypothetical protein
MRVSVAACALGLLVASTLPVRAQTNVRVKAGRIDITASATPLGELLRQLAKQTGMNLIFDGAPPGDLVTASLAGRSPVEAVNDLLKERKINYALAVDATGRVNTLIIVTAVRPQAAQASAPAAPAHPSAPASVLELLDQLGAPVEEARRAEMEAAEESEEKPQNLPLPDLLEHLARPTAASPPAIPEDSPLRRLFPPGALGAPAEKPGGGAPVPKPLPLEPAEPPPS